MLGFFINEVYLLVSLLDTDRMNFSESSEFLITEHASIGKNYLFYFSADSHGVFE